MTTVSPRKGHDPNRVNEISAKLMENPEIAELIGELSTSTDDASDLVKGLLQASINAGLQAEMDTLPRCQYPSAQLHLVFDLLVSSFSLVKIFLYPSVAVSKKNCTSTTMRSRGMFWSLSQLCGFFAAIHMDVFEAFYLRCGEGCFFSHELIGNFQPSKLF
ncbi:hypothetical protein CIP107538_02391 [Corynebacterium diphtheriae]|nr:hypothetical protein CIP107538_02391 [Corynebacterium diphtheriae]